MKNWKMSKGASFTLAAITLLAMCFQVFGQDPGWPRQKVNKGGKIIYYTPQVDEWKNHKDLQFRMAFSLTPTGKKQTVGVVVMKANTAIDVDNRTAYLRNIAISETHFSPEESLDQASLNKLLKTFLPEGSALEMSLDRLVAMAEKPAEVPSVPVKNDPPLIFVSYAPSMLIQVDGDPVMGKIKDTKLEFVVNSNFPVFHDRSKGHYYVYTGKRWLVALDPNGKWQATTTLPKDMTKLKADKAWAGLAGAIPPTAASGPVPTVFYTTKPAEVLMFQGQPIYTAIKGTRLLYGTNTESDLFLDTASNTFYYLVAGRWFRSQSMEGPWTYATLDLPGDFAKIPETSKAARVLGSVPGTEQAKDAVLLAQVPTIATVDPKAAAAQAVVTYSGDPEFRPIEGTSLQYAVNTAERVIKVGDVYYLCLNGVWFYSAVPVGPWTTATSVPPEIYTIPPSSPVYNVTYVTQTSTSDGKVESSYTAGYLGAFIIGATVGAVIACGTGYYYHPYYYYPRYGYPVYRPYAATYGVGAYYNPYNGAYGAARGVYGPYGGRTAYAGYNPYTGSYYRGASAYGPYGSASVGRAYNPYTGTAAVGRQGSTPYGQWGGSVISNGNQTVRTGYASNSRGTVAGAKSSTGAAVVAGSGQYNSGKVVRTADGDVYAGSNGNVYKKTDDGWQSYDRGNWNSAQPTAEQRNQNVQNRQANAGRAPTQLDDRTYNNLNRDAQTRQRGNTQTRSFESSKKTSPWGSNRSSSRSVNRSSSRGTRRQR